MAEADLRTRLEQHVELFNEAIRTGDFDLLVATFAAQAVMTFADRPWGPFRGREEISRAYTTRGPADTIALIDMEEVGTDAVHALFEWDAGGTGRMFLRWTAGELTELTITYTA